MRGLVDELCEAATTMAARSQEGDVEMVPAWCEALRACWGLAKGERARELAGDRTVKRFNELGLHPFSTEWGRLMALEALLPGLSDVREKHRIDDHGELLLLFVSPRVLRNLAYEAAEEEHAATQREELWAHTREAAEKLGLDVVAFDEARAEVESAGGFIA